MRFSILACLTFAVVAMMASGAHGAIVYYDLDPDLSISGPAEYSYNPLTGIGGSGTGGPISFLPDDFGVYGGGDWEMLISGSDVLLLAADDLVATSSGSWTTGWLNLFNTPEGEVKYWGIRYDDGDQYNYGWLEVRREVGSTFTLLSSGYNSSGSILAGQSEEAASSVPEPTSISVIATGVAVVALLRQRLFL